MPGLLSHYLCGDEMIKILDNPKLKDIILEHRQVFNIGTQGSDIFFYYIPSLRTRHNGLRKIGNTIHESNVTPFFQNAIDYLMDVKVMNMKGKGDLKELITAYICGYACHYSLDSNTHPYIFYRTGFIRPNEPYNPKYTCYHRDFETTLDFIMLDRLWHKKPSQINPYSLIWIKDHEAYDIGKMYQHILKNIFSIEIAEKQIVKSAKDMIRVQRALKDSLGIKKRLFKKIPSISNMIYPLKIDNNLDYLNLKGDIWCNPCDNSLVYKSSFIDMFDKAVKDSLNICTKLFNDIYHKENLLQREDYIGNRSFSTGLDSTLPLELKYFKCIYEE
ncbi:zinc dependent phospholipase C family protein [uncultured Clostridium sp.]|uniref:zinc dependent phospholipase C family protein n=1 Tax=uncultured Clostridium sp. TaxID=59620 RepID=UPI0028E4DEB2|nr:zinc dependent phospholipase C family protein [uncultured Clostridium sp.]